MDHSAQNWAVSTNQLFTVQFFCVGATEIRNPEINQYFSHAVTCRMWCHTSSITILSTFWSLQNYVF